MRIALHQKPIDIQFSRSATAALATRSGILLAEMKLIFGCMIRKQLVFREWDTGVDTDAIPAGAGLAVRFVPLMSRAACATAENSKTGQGLPTHEPLDNPRPYVPRWLTIDYRKGQGRGEFGYDKRAAA